MAAVGLLLDSWSYTGCRKSLDFYDNGRDNVTRGYISEGLWHKNGLFFCENKKVALGFMIQLECKCSFLRWNIFTRGI